VKVHFDDDCFNMQPLRRSCDKAAGKRKGYLLSLVQLQLGGNQMGYSEISYEMGLNQGFQVQN